MAYKQKNKWVASITLGGKKYRKTFSAKKYAQLWEQQKRREFELGVLDLQTTSYVEIKTLCENYIKDISQRARKTSAYQEKLRVKIILNYCDYKSIHCASEIDRDFWSGFIDWRRAGGAKPSTINIGLAVLSRIVKLALEKKILIHDPFSGCKKVKVDKPGPPIFFTRVEVEKIEAAIKDHPKHCRFYPLFYVFVRTGLRCSELANLEISDIDFENRKIILPPEKTKAREVRFVPINSDICELMQKNIEKNKKNNFIFTNIWGNKFSRNSIHWGFREAMTYCDDNDIVKRATEHNVHSLRRTYISNMVMAGVDPQKVMRVVGHKKWATMKRYLHLLPNYGNDIIKHISY